MDPKNWKKLQKMAYLAYAAFFIHLILVAPAEHIIIYSVILGAYLALKSYNFIFRDSKNKMVNTILVIIVFVAGLGLFLTANETVTVEDVINKTENHQYIDGEYSGVAKGYESLEVEVVVTIENDEITDVEVIDCGCTSYGKMDYDEAVKEIAEQLVTEEEVDSISGATKSINGLYEAVNEALDKAKA